MSSDAHFCIFETSLPACWMHLLYLSTPLVEPDEPAEPDEPDELDEPDEPVPPSPIPSAWASTLRSLVSKPANGLTLPGAAIVWGWLSWAY